MTISGIEENARMSQYKEIQRTTDLRRDVKKEPVKDSKTKENSVRPVQHVQQSFKIEHETDAVSVLQQVKAAIEDPDNKETLSRLNTISRKKAVQLLE